MFGRDDLYQIARCESHRPRLRPGAIDAGRSSLAAPRTPDRNRCWTIHAVQQRQASAIPAAICTPTAGRNVDDDAFVILNAAHILSLRLVGDLPPVPEPFTEFTSQYYRSMIRTEVIQKVCNLA